VLYTLGGLVLALVGVAVIRRPHPRLLVLSASLVVLGFVVGALAILAEGGAALGRFYLGVFVALLGIVGVVVFGVARLRDRRDGPFSRMPPLP
jgi:hypothetical protein